MDRRLANFARKFPAHIFAAMRIESEIELTEMKQRTPVDTGALRSSGHVHQSALPEFRTEFRFGGAAARYARIVHDDLEAFHPVGQAEYVLSVLRESAEHWSSRLGRRINLSAI